MSGPELTFCDLLCSRALLAFGQAALTLVFGHYGKIPEIDINPAARTALNIAVGTVQITSGRRIRCKLVGAHNLKVLQIDHAIA